MSKRLTYQHVKQYTENQGYRLISNEYKNVQTPVEIQCDKGHQYNVRCYNFQQGKRGGICYSNRKVENHHNWKGGDSVARFDTYSTQISFCEDIRRCPEDNNILEARCIYCNNFGI